jgi:hypothetical protein
MNDQKQKLKLIGPLLIDSRLGFAAAIWAELTAASPTKARQSLS